MLDINGILKEMTRPDLLVKAARHGMDDYNRSVHLRRILGTDDLPRPAPAIMKMIEIEQELNEQRKIKRATYSVARHVEILAAIMAEAKTLQSALRLR